MGCSNSKTRIQAPPIAGPKKSVDAPLDDTTQPPHTDTRLARIREIISARKTPFHYDRCSIEGGEVKALFAEGLVYRITKDDSWYIYNEALEYEAHVDYYFSPGSEVVGGSRSSLEKTEDDSVHVHAVVYPLETVLYISGNYTGYKSAVSIKPLSDEYLQPLCNDANEIVLRELDAVKETVEDETDEEIILTHCVQKNIKYVDVNFYPSPQVLFREGLDGHKLREVPMKRPSQYLENGEESQADVFFEAIVPHSIDPGNLGDCWLTSAAAVLAENETAVKLIFANTQQKERAVGAYRVAINKNGWWRSVIVDDYLPTVSNVPLFARISDNPRELWVSLLQKAYAKVHGSYSSITGGDALQALQDFTGMPTQRFDKEWVEAVENTNTAPAFIEMLEQCIASGFLVVLSTPSYNKESYLGVVRTENPDAFEEKYAEAGLQIGYTYSLQKVVFTEDDDNTVALLKVSNPWNVKGQWTGKWGWGSDAWEKNPSAAKACGYEFDTVEESGDTSFWISFKDAVNYFDGGGVVFTISDAVDYRIKGFFFEEEPSFVLEVKASEPVNVMFVISQQDKRGLPTTGPASRFAPVMLSVAKPNGSTLQVDKNSGLIPTLPNTNYIFTVARDVTLNYTFEPNDAPYLVIPRIHEKGVVEDYDRPFVLSVLSDSPLENKLEISVKHIDGDNRVFKNIATFSVGSLPSVEVEQQSHQIGQLATVKISSTVC